MEIPARTYHILSCIGEGGFGRVYRARLEAPDGFRKEVAIKLLREADPPASVLQRFRDEARMLGLVQDRAIIGVEPPVRLGDRWGIVMEYARGVSAGKLVKREALPTRVAVEVVGEVARALHNAFHTIGPDGAPLALLHRDVKPDNIQISPTGEVKLLDFGIARAEFPLREYRTGGNLPGTPGYIAPERRQGIDGPEADIYALGVVLGELVGRGRRGTSVTMTFEPTPETPSVPVSDEDPPPVVEPAADDDEVRALVREMTAADPRARPTAREVERACRDIAGRMTEPDLRDWAERSVPAAPEISDEWVGEVLVESVSDVPPPDVPERETRGGGWWPAAIVGLGIAVAIAFGVARSTPSVDAPRAEVSTAAPAPAPRPAPTAEVAPAPSLVAPSPPPLVAPPKRPVKPAPSMPPPAPPVAAVTWDVTLSSIPLGAELFVGDAPASVGTTPRRVKLAAGRHQVRMVTAERKSRVTTIEVGADMPNIYVWRIEEDTWESRRSLP